MITGISFYIYRQKHTAKYNKLLTGFTKMCVCVYIYIYIYKINRIKFHIAVGKT